jgi:hypothetical protein
VIYIREAHPTDGWAIRVPGGIELADPKAIEEQRSAAQQCEDVWSRLLAPKPLP